MLTTRIIPCLLLKDGGVVKTKQFKNERYIGDPINTVKIFNEKEVDELVILDIEASVKRQTPNFALLQEIASEAFMPLAYGGGIKTLEQMEKIFSLGFEKICVNSLLFENPVIIEDAVKRFGSQSITCSIDAKKKLFGKMTAFYHRGKISSKMSAIEATQLAVKIGIGEIIINSIEQDGTRNGYDLELINSVSTDLPVPLIAVGGAGSMSDFAQAVESGASAVCAGSFFVFQGKHQAVLISYPHRKEIEELFKKEMK